MSGSLVATVLISLRRTRAAWPIALAAGLTCLLAASLLAAGPMYADAVSAAGLRRVLTDAAPTDAGITVTLRTAPGKADDVERAVVTELTDVLRPTGGSIVRFARSDSFALPVDPAALDIPPGATPLVELGSMDGLDAHGSLVGGVWPTDAMSRGTVPVAVTDTVAAALGLRVGDQLSLPSRLQPDRVVAVRITGVFHIDDPADRYWWDDAATLDGVVASADFATYGPFFTTRRALLERAAGETVQQGWRAAPNAAGIEIDDIARLRPRIEALDRRLEVATGQPVTVASGLPAILAAADRSLLVARTGVLLLVVQLVVLAAYAVLLSAALLVDHRRVDTAMLRSRGAGAGRVAALTLVEGLVLTVPAALLGPLVALAALRLFDVAGPLTTIGLRIDPGVSIEAYIASTAAAIGCLIALVLPALPRRRSFASVRGGLSRAATLPAGQRFGLDIALLAIAGIGLWQLRHYGAPLTRTVQGVVGIDPLLVATPAIALLAGSVLALRVLPMLAAAIERLTARGRGLVSSLGARQLARRPLRYTRAALLLMLAMAMGVFAVAYATTWTNSQQDQADFQVGADARVVPGTGRGSPPRWALPAAYAGVPGIVAATPVDRAPVTAARAGRGEIVAMDAATGGEIVTLRSDLAPGDLAGLFAPLAEARPTLPAVALPAGTRRIALDLATTIRHVDRIPQTADGPGPPEAVDPAVAGADARLTARVVVRDGTGQLFRFLAKPLPLAGHPRVVVDLGDSDEAGTFADPLSLLAVELDVGLPADLVMTDATFGVDGLSASTRTAPPAGSDAAADGPWIALDPTIDGAWRTTASVAGQPHDDVETGTGEPTVGVGAPGLAQIGGVDRFGRGTTISFAPALLSTVGRAPVPVLVSTAFLAATGRSVGDETSVDIAGTRRPIRIVGEVAAFPTEDVDTPVMVMDLPTLALLRFEASDAVDAATEWWFTLDPARRDDVAAAFRAAPIESRAVTLSTTRAEALATDPVALGIIGALAIGAVAAGLFAVLGFVVSAAVSARERVAEFALLRAMGLSSLQLSSWLSLENAVLATVSLIGGTALGLLVAWIALPFVTVTQGGATPYPPVEVIVPWATVVILEAVALLTLGTTVLLLAWLLRRIGLAAVLRTGEE